MTKEHLKLTIIRGSNIKPKDSDSPSDLYAKILLFEGQYVTKHQTKVIKKSLHPIWNEEIDVEVDNVHPIRIEVYGKRSFRKDDEIGTCSIEWWLNTDLVNDGKAIFDINLKGMTPSLDYCGGVGKITLKLQNLNAKKEPGIVGVKEDITTIIAKTAKITIKPESGEEEKKDKKDKKDRRDDGDDDEIDISDVISESQITFNIWCMEKGEYQAITTSTKNTFEDVTRIAVIATDLVGSECDYRLFASPPAFRNKYCNDLPYNPKDKLYKAIRSKTVNFGDVLVLKKYNPEEKPYLRAKGKDVYEVISGRDLYLNVEFWKNSYEHSDPERMRIEMGQPLSEIVSAVCATHGGNADNARLYRIGHSSEPGARRSFVELDKDATMDQVYMTDGDSLAVRMAPPFKTFQEKFGGMDNKMRVAYSFIAHCYNNPIHRVWKKEGEESPLPEIARKLGLSESDAKAVDEAVAQNTLFGQEEILVELCDRIANTTGNKVYGRETFPEKEMYHQWLEEQRKEVLQLMEMVIVEHSDFCCEVEVKVVRGTNLLAADLNGLSDPYVILNYKTQRKTTRVINRTLNPVWNETLVFRVMSFDTQIGITCYDHDLDNNDDLLGTARFSLRENVSILDGEPHEFVIDLENKEQQGSLTFEVTCHHPYSRYFAFVKNFDFAKTASNKPIDIPYMDYYNELFTASGELESTSEDPSWYLREFSSRACISEGFCSLLKLQTLMLYGVPFSNTIRNYALSLVRFNSPPNKYEKHAFIGCLRNFLGQVKEKYVMDLFENAKTDEDIKLLPSKFSELVNLSSETESLLKKSVEGVPSAISMVEAGFGKSSKKLMERMREHHSWERFGYVLEYKDTVSTEYPKVMQLIVDCIEVVPEEMHEKLLAAASNSFGSVISQDIKKYCELVTEKTASTDAKKIDILKENVDSVIAEFSCLNVFLRDKGFTINEDPFNELARLWLRISTFYLEVWVKEIVDKDSRKMMGEIKLNKMVSTSYESIHRVLDDMMKQVESMVITDSMIWLQIGGVFMTTIKDYVNFEKEHAEGCFQNLDSKDEKILKAMCLHMSNIVSSTEFIVELNKRVEESMVKVNEERKKEKDIYFDSLIESLKLSYGEILAECNKGIDKITETLSKDCTNIVMGKFADDRENAFISVSGIYNATFNVFGKHSSDALLLRIQASFLNSLMNIFVSNIKPEILLCVNSERFRALLGKTIKEFMNKIKVDSTPERVLGGNEAKQFRKNVESISECSKLFNQIVEYFTERIGAETIQKNPKYVLITQYMKLYEAGPGTLISLYMKRTAKPQARFTEEETALFGGIDTDSIMVLIKYLTIDGDKWAYAYLKELSGSASARKEKESLGLPPDEFVLEKYGKSDVIILTSKSLFYAPRSSEKQSVALMNIMEVRATMESKVAKISVKIIKTSNAVEERTFHVLYPHGDYIVERIKKQAKEIGNTHLEK